VEFVFFLIYTKRINITNPRDLKTKGLIKKHTSSKTEQILLKYV